MKKTLLVLSLLSLVACSDNKAADLTEKQVQQYVAQPIIAPTTTVEATETSEGDEGYSGGEMIAAGVAGAAVGALAANALSNKKHNTEKCDWDDHPNEPECRGTKKYYDWKAEEDRKAKAKQRKSTTKKYKRKPR
jgi:hypothetical protein